MFLLLSMVAGMITALTVAQNGQLANFYGNYSAAVLIHLTGLITILLFRLGARKHMPEKQPAKPWMFLGGVVGVGTTVFTTMAYGGVGVTAILGLSLLGQIIASIVVDQLGLFSADKSPFFAGRMVGLSVVLAGAGVMLYPFDASSALAAILALLSGFTIVAARTINGQLAKRHGAMRSTVMNYLTGLITTTIIMLLVGRGEPLFTAPALSSNWFMYLGGALGVGLIMLLNITVNRVPAFRLTLLQFTGQIFTALVLDAITDGAFSWQNAVGGALVAIGLCIDVAMTKKHETKKQALPQ